MWQFPLELKMKLVTTALAQIVGEILLNQKLFFLERTERPTEAPDGW